MKVLVPIKQSFLFLWILGTTALCLGLLINQFRDDPLPLIHQGKAERMQSAVQRLVSAPAPEATSPVHEKLPTVLSLEEFSQYAEGKQGLVLDARPEIFHRLGHVPGAMSLAREDFENAYTALRSLLEKDRSQPLVVYCSGASCEDSELVKQSLEALGYTNVGIFRGGWLEWQAAGKAEEGGSQ